MTGGNVVGLVFAAAFLILALALSYLLVTKLSTLLKRTTKTIENVDARASVMLDNINVTVEHVNTALVKSHLTLDEVNGQLVKVDTMTEHAQQVTGNVANVSTLVAAAATNPLVKVAAFGFGVRRAAAKRRRETEEAEIRQTLKTSRRRGRHSAGK
ncbi:DUF948 domain-containing protein [Stackebrandtia albiflava]|uniref:DUF948 domain-containing protein n=1 Tax=Stackebrandtia albiflava TaxID=406432 RepID=UPI0011BE8540